MANKYEEDYLKFYEIYGRHEGKWDGQKAWHKLDMIDRERAQIDAEERARLKAWSPNKSKIPLPATYLNGGRFDDDWKETFHSTQAAENNKPRSEAPVFKPKADERNVTLWEKVLNKLFFAYVSPCNPIRSECGDPDRACDKALEIRASMLNVDAVALEEDLQSEATTKQDAIREFATSFLKRMDSAYNETRAERILRRAYPEARR